jgi:hypothetical protein
MGVGNKRATDPPSLCPRPPSASLSLRFSLATHLPFPLQCRISRKPSLRARSHHPPLPLTLRPPHRQNSIGEAGVDVLSPCLADCKALRELDLGCLAPPTPPPLSPPSLPPSEEMAGRGGGGAVERRGGMGYGMGLAGCSGAGLQPGLRPCGVVSRGPQVQRGRSVQWSRQNSHRRHTHPNTRARGRGRARTQRHTHPHADSHRHTHTHPH